MTKATARRKRRLGIASQVFIALALGIAAGIFFGPEIAFLQVGGDAFIALLQITVIPYVVVALITSLGRLTLKDAKELGLRAGSVLLLLWAVGLVVVLLSPFALPDWPSASFFSPSEVETSEPVDFLQLYIPSNIFFALSNAVVPAIVVFSILFGLALINVEHKDRVLDMLTTVGEVLMKITGFIGRLAPYGVFAITAAAAGTIDVADLGRLQVYIVIYVGLALLLSFWLIPGLIAVLTPLTVGSVLRKFHGPLITAFATGNVLIVLPILAADGKALVEENDPAPERNSERIESSVDILIPAAYPFPSLGGLLSLIFVLFGGWYSGVNVGLDQYPTIATVGLASLFGGTVLALPFLFDLLRLPADLFQVFLTVDVIGSRFGTLVAALHLLAIALIGTYALQRRITLRPWPTIRFTIISVLLLAATLLGIRAFYSHVYVAPYSMDELLTGLPLVGAPQPHTVHRELPMAMQREATGPLDLAGIRERGVLRVCFVPGDYPSSFFNTVGDLVGFDVEVTHRFARSLDLPIEFLPVQSVDEAAAHLDNGSCDVLMSLISVSPSRTERFAMTSPVSSEPVALVVRDHRRSEFRTWEGIRALPDLRVAISADPTIVAYLEHLLPSATAVPLEGVTAEIEQILRNERADIDAVARFAEEAAAWTIRFPSYSFIAPSPTVFVPAGYAVASGNTTLRDYLDTWLLNAEAGGILDELYRYWMLGEVRHTQPPRWSVIRDVLHWVD